MEFQTYRLFHELQYDNLYCYTYVKNVVENGDCGAVSTININGVNIILGFQVDKTVNSQFLKEYPFDALGSFQYIGSFFRVMDVKNPFKKISLKALLNSDTPFTKDIGPSGINYRAAAYHAGYSGETGEFLSQQSSYNRFSTNQHSSPMVTVVTEVYEINAVDSLIVCVTVIVILVMGVLGGLTFLVTQCFMPTDSEFDMQK